MQAGEQTGTFAETLVEIQIATHTGDSSRNAS